MQVKAPRLPLEANHLGDDLPPPTPSQLQTEGGSEVVLPLFFPVDQLEWMRPTSCDLSGELKS